MMNSAVCFVENGAEKFKDRVVFADKDREISFLELKNESRRIGTALLETVETGKTKPIIVYLEKSVNSIVSFMGAMYASSPYVPVDYNIPIARFEKTCENLKPAAVITDEAGALKIRDTNVRILIYDEIIKTESDDEKIDGVIKNVCDLDPAYIMYTSGSTGTPKGVTIPHRGVIDYILWVTNEFKTDENDIIGMQSAFHFDNSVFDMFAALHTGAKTMLIPEILFMYPDKLMEYMETEKISVIFWVPTVMISAANSGVLDNTCLNDLRLILFAGEVMPNKQLNMWRKAFPMCQYVNMYGPTEATDIAVYYIVDREFENHETLPIGKVCPNMKAVILNKENKLCEAGEQGELCIGGSGIALGYWNAPEITEKAFVQNPLNDKYYEKIYRTGDLVYENEEGNIIFIGRADSQIKLRGNRIELGEIESAASAVSGVRSACAMFNAEKEEIFLFLETSDEIKERKFKLELKKYIPSYMAPGKIITMENFPHTPSGKIDRVGLKNTYF